MILIFFVYSPLLNEYFDKQGRPSRNAAYCSISLGSSLFAKSRTICRDLETITCDPLISTMDHSKIYCVNQKEESISKKGLNQKLINMSDFVFTITITT